MWGFETLSYIYSMFTRKKIMFFQCEILNPLVYTLCSQEKNYFFYMEFETFSYIYSMFTRKKLFFQYEI
jgi:hypothetical protein